MTFYWLCYSTLSPIKFLHATADNMSAKTQKANILHNLEAASRHEQVTDVFIDGNVQLRPFSYTR